MVRFYLISGLIMLQCALSAQYTSPHMSKYSYGFTIQFGDQWLGLELPYSYALILCQAEISRPLAPRKSDAWTIVVMPQAGASSFRPLDMQPARKAGWELGTNLGIRWSPVLQNVSFRPYLLLSAGPHYISGAPERQSPGFIFSDNLAAGFRIPVSGTLAFDIRIGFRHLSNASLKSPNGGINTVLLGLGVHFN